MNRWLVTPDRVRNRLDFQVTEIAPCLIDEFEWDTKRWRVRFQSWPRKTHEADPIIDLLDVFPEDDPDYEQPGPLESTRRFSSVHELETRMRAERIRNAAQQQSKHGWRLRRVGDGVQGWFDLAKLPKKTSDKKPFASIDLKLNGTTYRCQFHVGEFREPREKPVAWQHTRGPSAGLPSLGKRR